MQRPVTAMIALFALALALTGCGNGDDPTDPSSPTAPPNPTGPPPITVAPPTGPPDHGWEGEYQIDFETGELTADGFNDLIDTDSPDWAATPLSTVSVLLRLDQADGTVETEEASEDGDPVVIVTISGLGDDSVTAMRYQIVLSAGDDDRYRLRSGAVSWQCHEGRGPDGFTTEQCV